MADALKTPPSLVFRLRDRRDQHAWSQFLELYGPVIYRYGRGRGLQDCDASDLMQEVLRAVVAGIDRFEYDPQRVKFRTWLFAVVRNQFCRHLARRDQADGGSDAQQRLSEQPERDGGEADLWELEYQRGRFQWAAEQVRPSVEATTWEAFWQTAVEGRPAAEVAAALGMNPGAVYTSRSRVLVRIRRAIEELGDE
jgi:RNA polymerase sigma-70 factor (ECF subfamily)